MRVFGVRFGAALLVGLGLSAAGAGLHAKENFPDAIQADRRLPYRPPCRLCHIQGTTGSGSVATPFGISMLAHGMTGSESSLAPALNALEADHTDSDGDGTPDITELTDGGTDPNTPANVRLVGEDPRYGCSVAPAGRSPRWGEVLASALALASALRTRSNRRSQTAKPRSTPEP
jgi:hypothetical protein